MNILDTIVAHKKNEVAERKTGKTVSQLEKSIFFGRQTLSLMESLRTARRSGIIAEFKRKSPSRGIINSSANVGEVTGAYADHGASAISVLTDEAFFGGHDSDLEMARQNDVPILRKEFIIDEYQVIEAKSIGADVILLIAACLAPPDIKRLAKVAQNLGLEVLLEIHDEDELEPVVDVTDLVGVNNRNLKNFEVRIDHSLAMGQKIPGDKIKIAESGIRSVDDVIFFRNNGFHGFLIGELFMKEKDPAIAFAEFTKKLPWLHDG